MPSLAQQVQDRWNQIRGRGHGDDITEHAQVFLGWCQQPYHERFLDWLYEQGDQPVKISDSNANLIAGTARMNTFKEIRHYLIDQEKAAHRVLKREQNG